MVGGGLLTDTGTVVILPFSKAIILAVNKK